MLSEAKDLFSCSHILEAPENAEILRGVYPERTAEILRSAQNDKRRAQDDRRLIFFTPSNTWVDSIGNEFTTHLYRVLGKVGAKAMYT